MRTCKIEGTFRSISSTTKWPSLCQLSFSKASSVAKITYYVALTLSLGPNQVESYDPNATQGFHIENDTDSHCITFLLFSELTVKHQ